MFNLFRKKPYKHLLKYDIKSILMKYNDTHIYTRVDNIFSFTVKLNKELDVFERDTTKLLRLGSKSRKALGELYTYNGGIIQDFIPVFKDFLELYYRLIELRRKERSDSARGVGRINTLKFHIEDIEGIFDTIDQLA